MEMIEVSIPVTAAIEVNVRKRIKQLETLDVTKVKAYELSEKIRKEWSWKVSELVSVLRIADDVYYNAGKLNKLQKRTLESYQKLFTDRLYDLLVDVLRNMSPTNPYLKKVGSPVAKAKGKKILPVYCGSLNKVQPTNVSKWLMNHSGPYVVSDKLDGNSALLVYKDNKIELFSRGDGRTGQDISHLIPHLRGIPNISSNIIVRGELIMSSQNFEKYKDEKANARNHVAGIANSNKASAAAKDIDFVAYEILSQRGRGIPSAQLKKLKSLGFKVVPFKVYSELDGSFLSQYLEKRKSNSKYDIDGIVIAQDKNNSINTSGNPDYAVAFKDIGQQGSAVAKVVDVEWNISRHGYLKPVVIIEPVKLSGVVIQRATGFNAKYIYDNKIGKGSLVSLQRRGDVIPHIVEVLKKAKKPLMPKEKFEWVKSGVDIYIPDAQNIDSVKIQRITHFFRALGVRDFSEGLVERLYEIGLNSIPKVIRASLSQLMKAKGIQVKTASKIREEIDKVIDRCSLPALMYASGCFSREVGPKRLEVICKNIPGLLSKEERLVSSAVSRLDGFSDITTTSVMQGLAEFKKFLKNLPDVVTFVVPKEKNDFSGILNGISVAFSGFRDKQLEFLITSNGGSYSSSVSAKTSILVIKEKNSSSSKVQKAKDNGIKIMTVPVFLSFLRKEGIKV